EAEGSYRTASGWYAYGGGTFAHVGQGDQGSPVVYGNVANAPAITAAGGISAPIEGFGFLSAELTYIGERATRTGLDPTTMMPVAGPITPGWFGLNGTIYIPNIELREHLHFDVTIGVRNILGKRDLVVAPQDYDRTDIPTTVFQVPGEGREY